MFAETLYLFTQTQLLARVGLTFVFPNLRFEPYVMVRKSSVLPEFNEQFFGYGKNKIQW